jgi:hypothetical protein
MWTMITTQRRDLASQRWEITIWDDRNMGSVVEWCDTYDELGETRIRCVEKAKGFLLPNEK